MIKIKVKSKRLVVSRFVLASGIILSLISGYCQMASFMYRILTVTQVVVNSGLTIYLELTYRSDFYLLYRL